MGVALVTLFERKILALTQFRLGPNKTLLKGILQPLIDGVKLLQKEIFSPSLIYEVLYLFAPLLVILIIVISWACVCSFPLNSCFWIPVWFLVVILSLGVYGVFIIGWASVSKYAFVGGIRSCAQTISYEVRFALILFSCIFLSGHPSLGQVRRLFFIFSVSLWAISCLAETNRAPLDLAEGESELIRGFNVELRRVLLAFVFVGEYGIVVCLAWLTRILFFSRSLAAACFWIFLYLLVRSSFPRLRYDKLMALCWIVVLPVAVFWIMISFVIRVR